MDEQGFRRLTKIAGSELVKYFGEPKSIDRIQMWAKIYNYITSLEFVDQYGTFWSWVNNRDS